MDKDEFEGQDPDKVPPPNINDIALKQFQKEVAALCDRMGIQVMVCGIMINGRSTAFNGGPEVMGLGLLALLEEHLKRKLFLNSQNI